MAETKITDEQAVAAPGAPAAEEAKPAKKRERYGVALDPQVRGLDEAKTTKTK